MSTATEMLALYIAAEQAVLKNKTYTIAGRSFGREDLDKIRAGRHEWQAKVNAEAAAAQGGSSLYSVADWTQ